MTLLCLVTFSISSCRNLDIKANTFYDRANRLYDAALLTRRYIQQALWPYIDSKMNHIWHFIKDQFVNKKMEFINLSSIFKDKSIFSFLKSPITCYKYRNIFVVPF